MTTNSDTNLASEYADDWITQDTQAPEKQWQPAPPVPEAPLTKVAVTTDAGHHPAAVEVTSPNGTRVGLTADPITGGIRITQVQTAGVERGMLSAVAMGLGVLVLDDRP